jgi:hypothetical protein
MRITLDIHSFDDFDKAAFASLWLDTPMRRWSREGHESLELPRWGILEWTPTETQLYGPSENEPELIVCLEKLDIYRIVAARQMDHCNLPPGLHGGASGRALLYDVKATNKPAVGRWRILYIDHETTQAEHSNFTDQVD